MPLDFQPSKFQYGKVCHSKIYAMMSIIYCREDCILETLVLLRIVILDMISN